MKALVFERHYSGHRLTYLRLLLPALADLAYEVVLVTHKDLAPGSPHLKHLGKIPGNVRIEPSIDIPNTTPWKTAKASRSAFGSAIVQWKPDHVFIPTADGLSQVLGMMGGSNLGDIEAEACIHHLTTPYPKSTVKGRTLQKLSWRAMRRAPWTWFHHVDVLAYDWVCRHGGKKITQRSSVLADPVEFHAAIGKAEARRNLGLPEDGRYIGCVGNMDTRKGIDLLIRAFASADLQPTDRLLLAGPFAPMVRTQLEVELTEHIRRGQVHFIDRYVSVAEMGNAISALDVVATPYPAHVGIASILLRAAAAQRPVLSSDYGWLGWITHKLGLGWTQNVRDPDAFAASIRQRLEDSAGFTPSHASEKLVEFHNPANFTAAWTRRFRQRLGLAPKPEMRWQTVLDAAHKETDALGPPIKD